MLQAGPASIQGGWSKLAVLLFLPIFALQAAGQRASEYQLKAAFLYNFTKFIDWPGESVRSLTFQICVLGQNPFGSELTRLTDGKLIGGHPVQVLTVSNYDLARSCQVVFISASENAHMTSSRPKLRLITQSGTNCPLLRANIYAISPHRASGASTLSAYTMRSDKPAGPNSSYSRMLSACRKMRVSAP